MHKMLRKLLDEATGASEYVVALNVDVRGFSAFNARVGDADTAQYVKKLYIKLVDAYFKDASFFKPTGDGLIITLPYTEATLEEVATSAIERSIRVVDEFASLLLGDRMITFDVPQQVGIGVARGSTMRLSSSEYVLDYSGRVLNLASRLMSIARPGGVVIDGAFGVDMLSSELQSSFQREDGVYLAGLAEVDPISVWYTPEHTEIPAAAKRPLREYEWAVYEERVVLKDIVERPTRWWYWLEKPLADERGVSVKVDYPLTTPGGRRRAKGWGYLTDVAHELAHEGDRVAVIVNMTAIAAQLRAYKVKDAWDVRVTIRYPTY